MSHVAICWTPSDGKMKDTPLAKWHGHYWQAFEEDEDDDESGNGTTSPKLRRPSQWKIWQHLLLLNDQ